MAPPDLVANSCLFVMGSEGRGEQLLKTDQDNGLVLRDGYECPVDLAEVCQRFSDRAGGLWLPGVPGQHHGQQPALAPKCVGLQPDGAPVVGAPPTRTA
jgi:CBS domain-containing protein